MARQRVIIAGQGFVVGGTLNVKNPRWFISDRKANREGFVNERILRFPRRWSRNDAWLFYPQRDPGSRRINRNRLEDGQGRTMGEGELTPPPAAKAAGGD